MHAASNQIFLLWPCTVVPHNSTLGQGTLQDTVTVAAYIAPLNCVKRSRCLSFDYGKKSRHGIGLPGDCPDRFRQGKKCGGSANALTNMRTLGLVYGSTLVSDKNEMVPPVTDSRREDARISPWLGPASTSGECTGRAHRLFAMA